MGEMSEMGEDGQPMKYRFGRRKAPERGRERGRGKGGEWGKGKGRRGKGRRGQTGLTRMI